MTSATFREPEYRIFCIIFLRKIVQSFIKGPDILTENISGMMKGRFCYDSADKGKSQQ